MRTSDGRQTDDVTSRSGTPIGETVTSLTDAPLLVFSNNLTGTLEY